MVRYGRLIVVLLGLFAPGGLADAAVRTCKPLVIGAAREAADELTAKKLALESWLGLAQQSGPGFTRWQLAERRALSCHRLPAGVFQCQAAGAPCTILQTPQPLRNRGVAVEFESME